MKHTTIWDIFTKEELNDSISQGLVKATPHHTLPIINLNYTPVAQFSNIWNRATANSRGLVYNKDTDIIVARSFPKFFNLGQDENGIITEIPVDAIGYEKMDGSMGNLFNYEDKWMISTRGSFISDQTKVAYQLLQTDYIEYLKELDPAYNYIVEIIYPENRIVLKYDYSRLVLLATIKPDGTEKDIQSINWPYKPKQLKPDHTPEEVKSWDEENQEGYVYSWLDKDGTTKRVKVKFDNYLALHRTKSNLTNKRIWEVMLQPETLPEFLAQVPDEFYDKVQDHIAEIQQKLEELSKGSLLKANELRAKFGDDKRSVYEEATKDTSLYHPVIVMRLYNDPTNDVKESILKTLKPEEIIHIL